MTDIPSDADGANAARPAQVFYDGACPVCSRQARACRRRAPDGALELVDIAAEGFDANRYGLDAAEVGKALHVRLPDGQVRRGLEALRAIWSVTPALKWLGAIAGWPGVHSLLAAGYRVFAANRHRLADRRSRNGGPHV